MIRQLWTYSKWDSPFSSLVTIWYWKHDLHIKPTLYWGFIKKGSDTVEWGGRQGPPCISTAAFAQSFQGRKKERTGGTTTTTTAAHGGRYSGDCMLNAAAAAAAARRTACTRPLCSSERSSSKSCNLPEGQGPSASPDTNIFIICK